ncbi:hypothetical protein [uncultured Bacteroides sp.]|uniref:hypothetical protein n=1 Tax=uncultured Bacteroides sp. TaxID=162156 RepID=UPI002AAA7EC1|nr:hypothetical protein [uncultured Bacteroides sp.]
MSIPERLLLIIDYKTSGHHREFAHLMGWSDQYLSKLVKGGNFGLSPVMAILEKFPEISARWFIFGTGEMIQSKGPKISDLSASELARLIISAEDNAAENKNGLSSKKE